MDSWGGSDENNGYSGGSHADGTADFNRLTGLISSNIQKIQNNVQQMLRLITQLGTAQDNDDLRHKLHQIQHGTREISQQTNKLLKELHNLPGEQRQWRLQRERLANELMVVLNKFQTAQRDAEEKEKASMRKMKQHTTGTTSATTIPLEPDENDIFGSDLNQQQQRQSRQQQVLATKVDLEQVKERTEALHQLQSDIDGVNQIFKDLALMVHEQGETVDSIEQNVDTAVIQVESAATNISQAAQYKASARRKKIYLIMFAILAAFIIGLVLYFFLKK